MVKVKTIACSHSVSSEIIVVNKFIRLIVNAETVIISYRVGLSVENNTTNANVSITTSCISVDSPRTDEVEGRDAHLIKA